MAQGTLPHPRFSAIVFDFDGTLVDTNAIKRAGFFKVIGADSCSQDTMRQVIDRIAGDRREVFTAFTVAMGIGGGLVDDLVGRYSMLVDAEVAAAPEFDGATVLLNALRQQSHLVFLSSATPQENLSSIIHARGWRHLFDGIFGRPNSKIETLKALCGRYLLAPADIAVVGDGEDDRESARTVGCTFFAVNEARGAGPDEKTPSLLALHQILLGVQRAVSA